VLLPSIFRVRPRSGRIQNGCRERPHDLRCYFQSIVLIIEVHPRHDLFMAALLQDLRYAVRILRRTPGFTVVALLALSLGIAAGVSVLGLVRTALLAPHLYTDQAMGDPSQGSGWRTGWTGTVQTVAQVQDNGVEALILVLLGLTLLVLAIACINIVLLLLARATTRRGEIALRATFGAGRRRLARQLLTEAAIPSLLGSAAGLSIGAGGAHLLTRTWPSLMRPWQGPTLDSKMAALVASVLVLVMLAAWLSPLGAALHRNLRGALGTGGRTTAAPWEGRLRNGFVVLQFAACLVLLTGAGLLIRSFAASPETGRAAAVDPHDTLTVRLRLPETAYADARQRSAFNDEALTRIRRLPGVMDTSLASTGAWVGLGTEDGVRAVCPECRLGLIITPITDKRARIHAVSPGFFRTLGISLRHGRELEPARAGNTAGEAVINEAFAYRLFPNGNPLGKQVQVGGREGDWYTVVGVAEDVRARGIGIAGEPVPMIYLSTHQHPPGSVGVAVRTAGDPMQLATEVEGVLRTIEPELAALDIATMADEIARFRAPLRWFAGLFAVLATLALLLAITGLYGVMSYNTERRTREIGLRMAVGAHSRDVMRLIVGQSLRLTALGALLGLLGALSLARLLQLQFYGVRPLDPVTFGTIALLLGGTALVASYRPARRAARVDPMIALRTE
jgi:putative ABC transport system permease protein